MTKNILTKILLIIIILFLYLPLQAADSNVRLNSIGFLPNNVKGFTTSMNGASFTVVRVSDSAVMYTGTLGGAVAVADSGETVYKGDFSSFATPGIYRVNVAGVGNSVNFVIADDAYNQTFITTTRAMYLWRCNTAVTGSFTYNGSTNTFSHAACHRNDAYLDYVNGSHTIRNGMGGWHDAGDYNKYIVNAGAAVGPMFMAWEHFSAQINTLDTGIPNDPEAGQNDSAYPDYLKELRYEIKYVLRSAYPDGTGRVSAKLSALDFDAFEPPENETADRFFTSWGSAATADYVAMLAMAARVFYPYDPAYSQTCITAARTAYNYLLANTANVNPVYTDFSTGGYGTTDGDDRLWAAAEMWATTGDADAHTDFQNRANTFADKTDEDWDWSNMKNLGMYTYLMCTRTGKNAAIRNDIQADLLADANAAVTKSNNHGYGRNLGTNYYWGCNGSIARQVMLFQIANRVSPNANYVTASLNALGYLFGRNYHRRSYVTDVGASAPMFPHDRRSGSDGITNPWPGYLVGGSSGTRNDPWQTANLAAGLPAAQYWSDAEGSYSSNEIAINWQAGLIYALAAFVGTAGTPTFTPTATGTITGTPPTSTVTPTLTLIPTIGVVTGECVQGPAFTIDGSLNESDWGTGTWTSVTRVVSGTTPAPVSARYKVRWDATYVYVGVEVTDPALVNDSTNYYDDDSVEVYIDANNNQSATYAADDFQYYIGYNDPNIGVNPAALHATTTGLAKTAVIAGGYSAEFRLPWSELGRTAIAGLTIGFDVGVNYDQNTGVREGTLMWNGTATNYNNTSAFGDCVLLACAAVSPTNTRTRTVSPTFTRTATASATPQNTFTATASVSPSYTNTRTLTSTPGSTSTYTRTATRTNTPQDTATNTPVSTATDTRTSTATNTPVNTSTHTPSATGTFTRTSTFTRTVTVTNTPTRTVTSTFTVSQTHSVSPTVTETVTGTPPTETNTPSITETHTTSPTDTVTDTMTATPTDTPVDTKTFTPTVTLTKTNTPVNTNTNTPVDTSTNTPVNTSTQTFTRTSTPVNTSTPSFTPTVTRTLTFIPTSTPTVGATAAIFEIVDPVIFPNPFNPAAASSAYFRCDLTQDAANIKIKIYTAGFRAVKEIVIPGIIIAGRVDRRMPAVELNKLANGIYYYTVIGENGNNVKARGKSGMLVILK